MTITTIIFDLGGVLIDWNPEYLYRKIFDNETEMHHFLREVCTSEWNEQQDAGRSWKEATRILIEKHPEYESQITAYWKRWPEMLNGSIPATVAILKELKETKPYRLLALTNWSAETFPVAREQFDFLNWFEAILVSGEEFLKKPDPEIFELLLSRYQLNPPECIFIDDSLRNIEAARKHGIHSLHFSSPEGLKKELQKLGVL